MFADLSPSERVAEVEQHLATLPDDTPTLSPATTAALARIKLVLAQWDDLSDDEREHEVGRWHAHLATLNEHDDDAARYELLLFWERLDGLVRSEGEP
jgi:hypothetical protein